MLKSVSLTNFQKHRHLEVEFDRGLTVIRGPNYGGKTTIVKAVAFALFGATMVPGGASVIPTFGEKDCSVSLEFEVDGRTCSITRSLRNATLSSGDEVLATGHTSVNAWVEAHVCAKADYHIVLNSPQGETAALLTLGSSAIQKLVERLSGVDLIDRVVDLAVEDQKTARAQADALEVQDIEPLVERLELASAEARSAERLLDKALEAMAEAEAEADRASREHKDFSIWLSQVEDVERDLERARAQAAEREATLKETLKVDLADITRTGQEVESLHREARALRARHNTLQGAVLAHDHNAQRLPALNEKLAKAQAGAEAERAWNKAFDTLASEYDAAETEFLDLQDRSKAAQAHVQGHRKAVNDAVCSACQRPLDEAQLEAALVQLQAWEDKHKALEAALAEHRFRDLKRKADELNSRHPGTGWDEKVRDLEAEITQIGSASVESERAEMLKTERRLSELDGLLRERSEELKSMEVQHARWTAATDELARARGAISTLEQALGEALSGSPKQEIERSMREAEAALERWRGELGQHQARARDLTARKAEAVAAMNELERQVKRTREESKRKAEFVHKATLAGDLAKFLRTHRAQFVDDMWAAVLGNASAFARAVTRGSLNQVMRRDGQFWYEQDGVELPFAAASGAMKSIAGVGLRLALEKVCYGGSGMLVLDEPSADLSEENAASLVGALMAENRQIVLITHREAEQFVSGAVVQVG